MMFKPPILFSYRNYFVDQLHLKHIRTISNLSVLPTRNCIICIRIPALLTHHDMVAERLISQMEIAVWHGRVRIFHPRLIIRVSSNRTGKKSSCTPPHPSKKRNPNKETLDYHVRTGCPGGRACWCQEVSSASQIPLDAAATWIPDSLHHLLQP